MNIRDTLKRYENSKSKSGVPMFTDTNITKAAKNELDLITRRLLADKGITKEEFTAKFREYGDTLTNLTKNVIANRQVNLLSAISKGNLTFNRLKECICHVLQFKLINIKFTFLDENNELYEIDLRNDQTEKKED